MFANHNEENAVYPHTLRKIVESHSADITMGHPKTQPGYSIHLVKNTMILYKDGKLVIPHDLKDRAAHGITIISNTQA
jgi:hypothetical protein